MAEHGTEMIIDGRFNGPPGSGNGGYSAGRFAAAASGGPAVVTLRLPPPLDTPLTVTRTATGIEVYDGPRLIAEAAPAPDGDAPAGNAVVPSVPYEAALAAGADYRGLIDHPFPTCFVCGPDRDAGDGLRLFPGPLPGGRTAGAWTVPQDVSAAVVWAALDCPGGWAIIAPARPYVLGRMTASVRDLPRPGDRCVVMGQAVAVEGRKARVLSTLYGPDGTALAAATAIWIAI
jgi:hypothetical protein